MASGLPPELPFIVTVHDLIDELESLDSDSGGAPSVDITERASFLARAAAIIVPSHATAAALKHVYGSVKGPMTVIHHCIDHVFTPCSDPLADNGVRKTLKNAGSSKPFLLHVGGRAGYKNFSAILTAFALEPSIRDRFDLVSVGSEPYPRPEDRAILRDLGQRRVHFLGYLSPRHLAAAYRLAAVVVCPSRAEGFGLTPPEAVACGARLICSDIDPHREIIQDRGIFFGVADPAAIGQAIDNALGATDRLLEQRSEEVRSLLHLAPLDRIAPSCPGLLQ